MKRQRGRNNNRRNNNNNQNNNPNRSMDSNGPDVKVRGSANTIYEKYVQLASDAKTSGNRVKAESYLQHAEHYLRLHRSMQPKVDPAVEAAKKVAAEAAEQGGGEDKSTAPEQEPKKSKERREPRSRRPRREDRNDDGRSEEKDASDQNEERVEKPKKSRKPKAEKADAEEAVSAPSGLDVITPDDGAAEVKTRRRRAPVRKAAPKGNSDSVSDSAAQ